MKGKYLKMRGVRPAHVYTVHGTAKEIADYIEKQGENCRFLQADGTISPEETATPVNYQFRSSGETPTLVWNPEYENWDARINWLDAYKISKVEEELGISSTKTTRTEEEDEDDDAPVVSKPTSSTKKKSLK